MSFGGLRRGRRSMRGRAEARTHGGRGSKFGFAIVAEEVPLDAHDHHVAGEQRDAVGTGRPPWAADMPSHSRSNTMSCAAATTPYTPRSRSCGSPTNRVRVMSLR